VIGLERIVFELTMKGLFAKRRASEGSEAAPDGNPDDTEIL
jgi:hypothetical protein